MTAVADPSPESPERPAPLPIPAREHRLVDEIGEIVRFTVTTLRELPLAVKYPTELLRQVSKIITGSAVVVFALLLIDGVLVGEIGHYLLGQIGAQSYVGLFAAAGTLKGSAPIFFGYMVAAKIGCGFAAELGAMQINEEVDAMKVMGIPIGPYLVGTRVLAFMIAAPFLWLIGIGICFYANYVTNVVMLGSVSAGGYTDVFWSFTTPTDFAVRSLLWACGPAVLVVIVSCFYGMTAKGGPVGVGENTAKSMVANVVLVSVLGAGILFQLIYGTTIVVPIAN